jgi:hypothetical protein
MFKFEKKSPKIQNAEIQKYLSVTMSGTTQGIFLPSLKMIQ